MRSSESKALSLKYVLYLNDIARGRMFENRTTYQRILSIKTEKRSIFLNLQNEKNLSQNNYKLTLFFLSSPPPLLYKILYRVILLDMF